MHSGVSHPPSRHFIGPSPYRVALPILNSISSTRTLHSPFTYHYTPLFLLSHHTIYSPSSDTHTHTSSPISSSHSLSSPPSSPTLFTISTLLHSLFSPHTPPSSSTTHAHHNHTHTGARVGSEDANGLHSLHTRSSHLTVLFPQHSERMEAKWRNAMKWKSKQGLGGMSTIRAMIG